MGKAYVDKAGRKKDSETVRSAAVELKRPQSQRQLRLKPRQEKAQLRRTALLDKIQKPLEEKRLARLVGLASFQALGESLPAIVDDPMVPAGSRAGKNAPRRKSGNARATGAREFAATVVSPLFQSNPLMAIRAAVDRQDERARSEEEVAQKQSGAAEQQKSTKAGGAKKGR